MILIFKGSTASTYDDWYNTKRGSFVDEIETQAAFTLFNPSSGVKILDAGCGTGNFSIKLHNMGCIVTGIDLSVDMLAIARNKITSLNISIPLQEMNLYELDFPDYCFDAVFSMAAFEFIHDPEKAYQEMYRVLKPGGTILIGTINKDSNWGQMYMELASTDASSVFRHADFKTIDDLKKLDPEHLVNTGKCLFIPPQSPEDDFNYQYEAKMSAKLKPGFILAMWKKPL